MPRYLYTSRPPSIGCQPDGFTNREVWIPSHEVDGRHYLGVAEYDKPLDFKDIRAYELMPEEKGERLVYMALRAELEWWVFQDYYQADEDVVKSAAARDFTAYLVTEIKGMEEAEKLRVLGRMEKVLSEKSQ